MSVLYFCLCQKRKGVNDRNQEKSNTRILSDESLSPLKAGALWYTRRAISMNAGFNVKTAGAWLDSRTSRQVAIQYTDFDGNNCKGTRLTLVDIRILHSRWPFKGAHRKWWKATVGRISFSESLAARTIRTLLARSTQFAHLPHWSFQNRRLKNAMEEWTKTTACHLAASRGASGGWTPWEAVVL